MVPGAIGPRMTEPLAMSFASVEFLPGFEGCPQFKIVDSAERFNRNIEPVGDIPLGVALLDNVIVVLGEFVLNFPMVGGCLFHREPFGSLLECPIREVDDSRRVDVDFAVTDFEMEVGCR